MRLIGHLENQTLAERISQFLVAEGIQNQVEPDDGPRWALWILAEEDLERARNLLGSFLANPEHPLFKAAPPARPIAAAREASTRGGEGRASARPRRPRPQVAFTEDATSVIWVTLGFLVLCIVVALNTQLRAQGDLVRLFQMSEVPFRLGAPWERFLPEVRDGQVWRVFTPALLHFGLPHILFNLWTFWDLGNIIERRRGSAGLLVLILGLGIVSNLGQYLAAGPRFGGMSGVIYGLLGYVWMMGRFRPEAGMGLHPQTVLMMLVWFFVCWSGALGMHIANTAHGVGLVAGVLWGLIAARRPVS